MQVKQLPKELKNPKPYGDQNIPFRGMKVYPPEKGSKNQP